MVFRATRGHPWQSMVLRGNQSCSEAHHGHYHGHHHKTAITTAIITRPPSSQDRHHHKTAIITIPPSSQDRASIPFQGTDAIIRNHSQSKAISERGPCQGTDAPR